MKPPKKGLKLCFSAVRTAFARRSACGRSSLLRPGYAAVL